MTLKTYSHAAWKSALAMTLGLSLLVGCGGGGSSKTSDNPPGSIPSASSSGIRALPAAFTSRKAVAYSPFRGAQGATVSSIDIKQDLDLLVQAGIGIIRLFDSSDNVAKKTLDVIRTNNMDIKVMLGIYVGTFEYLTDNAQRLAVQQRNEDEMARGVSLAKTYSSEVIAVSVGNETMVSWSYVPISTNVMAGYIKTVRDQITQPVTTDDNWAFYAGDGRNASDQVADILRQIDFASIHTYAIEDVLYSDFTDSDSKPDWDWRQTGVSDLTKRAAAMMDAALGKTKKDYNAVRAFLDSNGRASMPIIIGETGWKAAESTYTNRYRFLAHPSNQKMFYVRLLDWAMESRTTNGPKGIVYFEAFDEPWKGADDKWGLFTTDRKARCAAQALNPAASWTIDSSSSCNESAALYFTPLTINAAINSNQYVIHNESNFNLPSGLASGPYEPWMFLNLVNNYDITLPLFYPSATGDSAPGDTGNGTSHYISLDNINPYSYGWGYQWYAAGQPPSTVNLSNFTNGAIKFSINTNYIGKLRIGVSSDTDVGTVEAFVLVSEGDTSGYCRNGWCNVSLPLSKFKAANPKLDVSQLISVFSIADIFEATGNTVRPTSSTVIKLDNIYWSR